MEAGTAFGRTPLTCIIGADVLSAIVDLYWDEDLDPEKEELVFMAQRAVAYFAWGKVVPVRCTAWR